MAGTITGETKREGQRKARRRTACKNKKKRKGRELASLAVRSYFIHGRSNVICMQIVMGSLEEQASLPTQSSFL
jgi:hypothetical protein